MKVGSKLRAQRCVGVKKIRDLADKSCEMLMGLVSRLRGYKVKMVGQRVKGVQGRDGADVLRLSIERTILHQMG